jgi:hypothetical protein
MNSSKPSWKGFPNSGIHAECWRVDSDHFGPSHVKRSAKILRLKTNFRKSMTLTYVQPNDRKSSVTAVTLSLLSEAEHKIKNIIS